MLFEDSRGKLKVAKFELNQTAESYKYSDTEIIKIVKINDRI